MTAQPNITWPQVPCQCNRGTCICPPEKTALRAWVKKNQTTSMTAEQRTWCLDEIASVEGFDPADYEHLPDDQLARGVLNAWTEYCRDKGLL